LSESGPAEKKRGLHWGREKKKGGGAPRGTVHATKKVHWIWAYKRKKVHTKMMLTPGKLEKRGKREKG